MIVKILLFLSLSQSLLAAPPIDHLQAKTKIIETQPAPVAVVAKESLAESKTPSQLEPLLGYQVWKEKQIQKAKTNLNAFKTPKDETLQEQSSLSIQNVENSAEKAEIEKIQNNQAEKLRQLEFNLEIALGLTIHDYFSLYLKDKSKEEMALVIPKLTPDELSALLVAYRKALYGLPIVEKENGKALNQNL